MSKDLMELVEGCPVYEVNVLGAKGEEVISEYRKLGFTKATEETYQKNLDVSKRQRIYEFEYRVITTKTIRKFLQRKVKLYDKKHKPKPKKKIQPDCNFPEMVDEMARAAALPGFFSVFHTAIKDSQDIDFRIESEIEKPPESTALDPSAEERMREKMMRSFVIQDHLMGMSQNMRSAQEELILHRQRGMIEAEQHRQREAQIHQVVPAPIDFHAPWRNPSGACSIYEKTCDYDKLDPKTIGRFEWKEERVEDYDGLPPALVIETFKEHKAREVFDYFTIASVNSVPDPLLLGRIDGDDDNRWFIDNWGTDVCLDDLI